MAAIALVAIDMGYGHLRPAHALAAELGVEVLEVDRPPLADASEQAAWARTRRFYENLSRLSQARLGLPLRALLDNITDIPHLHPERDLSEPNGGARGLAWMMDRGLGVGLARYLEEQQASLLTTFYAPAIVADRRSRRPAFCVVTDSDINRVWVPADAARSRVRYFAPSRRVVRRLTAYGVRPELIDYTGFPLPGELVGRDRAALHRNLAARLVRLDPQRAFLSSHQAVIEREIGKLPDEQRGRPPLLTFAVGGAGAQAELVEEFIDSLRAPIAAGKLRLALVAGVRPEVAARFAEALDRAAVRDVLILLEPDIPSYLRAFNALMAETDILWSKPSEIAFFAGLGIPLVLAPPVGVHEGYNRRWVLEAGAAVAQDDTEVAGGWLREKIEDGTLAAAAWSGGTRLPSDGVYRIADAVR